MTLFRSILALIKQNLRHHQRTIKMHTENMFPGRDIVVVMPSLVRSNERNAGDL